jgi:hypothetical protein
VSGRLLPTYMTSAVRTELCLHPHIGFLVPGRVQGTYGYGCTFEHVAPRVVVLEPGRDTPPPEVGALAAGGQSGAVVV